MPDPFTKWRSCKPKTGKELSKKIKLHSAEDQIKVINPIWYHFYIHSRIQPREAVSCR